MPEPITLDFETFWNWLLTHPNCILRAGTPEAVVYDDDDLHWHFAEESSETLLVQVMRGKRFVGEILLQPEQVTYVQGTEGEQEGEYAFELVAESEKGRFAVYFFVLTHGFDEQGTLHKERVH
ncbi:MAG: hypothetical protein OES47_06445 [Acidobacteriota bacterium]|nr:hypothetical protein [Acidobacteriota bacterium]